MRVFASDRLSPVVPCPAKLSDLTDWFEVLYPPRKPADKVRHIEIDPADHPLRKAERQLALIAFEAEDWKKQELRELFAAWADLRSSVDNADRLRRFDTIVHRLAGNGSLIGAETEAALLTPVARALEAGWRPAFVPLVNLAVAAVSASARERRQPADPSVRNAISALTMAFAGATSAPVAL